MLLLPVKCFSVLSRVKSIMWNGKKADTESAFLDDTSTLPRINTEKHNKLLNLDMKLQCFLWRKQVLFLFIFLFLNQPQPCLSLWRGSRWRVGYSGRMIVIPGPLKPPGCPLAGGGQILSPELWDKTTEINTDKKKNPEQQMEKDKYWK